MPTRQNYNNLLEIRNANITTLYHCTAFESEDSHHLYCTKGKDSWCKWQSEKETGEKTYKQKVSFGCGNNEKIKPNFQDLADTKTLEKCLHVMTQNCNKSAKLNKTAKIHLHLKNC